MSLLLVKCRKGIISTFVLLLISSPFFNLSIYADEVGDEETEVTYDESIDLEDIILDEESNETEKYSTYIQDTEADHYQGEPIVFEDMTELKSDRQTVVEGEPVIQVDQDETASFTIEAPETAYYQIGFEYKIQGVNVL